ncbi:MAG TPA: exonuclease subunit SbcD [Actinomycetota bacterium]
MRFLHTSDWHVGKTLRGRDRSDEHRAVLAEIAGIARDRAVDLVIVAGDLFDSAAPTPEAERIVYRALLDLAEVAPVLVVSGNHDNDRRLAAVAPLLGLGRVTTRAHLAKPEEGGVFSFTTAGGERAQVALLPWISQRFVVKAAALMSLDASELPGEFAERWVRIVRTLTEGFSAGTVNVVAGHAMIQGGALGGGERMAHTIFDYTVSANAFPAQAHYVALGHLHRAQQLGAQPPVWYCGSPLQLDFGETADRKCVLVVEATPSTPATAEQVPLTSGRALRRVAGTLADLHAAAGTTGDDFLQVLVHEQARAGLNEEVRALFGENAVDVRVHAPGARELGIEPRPHDGRSPHDLFADYLTERSAEDERVLALFDELMDEVHAPGLA